ncbi:glycine cleavage system protein GcvH [Geomonas paludis]|uniref:Glycine cleavage system H protein n=2 Tax=Geomonas TaxID=2651583 RepID=A0A6V8MVX3_9BACT|nr:MULTISPECIES: glycine cleavage system protein GcvH [Geomonas]MBJ6749636.1 glycine cleavage system protein GcvH [Geomonas anaerohicana]UPU37581.1 glycine cleavage system protein GcvH [Geomonas paludis]GFO63887.1 glycine cleavage system H protein [Geomonas paludis]
MDFPEELKYSKEHLWVRVEGDRAVIGVTDYAQVELGNVTSVELPEPGDELEQDDSFGSIEARKTVADLYAPLSGTVLEVNSELGTAPEFVNDDPYDGGWLVVIEMADAEELNLLMSAELYEDTVSVSED